MTLHIPNSTRQIIAAWTAVLLLPVSCLAEDSTLANKLYAGYNNITSISCEIRKTSTAQDQTVRMLSRVYYQKPGKIHVDNVSPVRKRIISDGTNLYFYQNNALRGFSCPVAELKEPMLSAYKNIPSTPMEHLRKLTRHQESPLPPTQDFAVRKAYKTEKMFVVLSADNDYKLQRIEFFKTSNMKEKSGEYNYSEFQKAGEKCWIPTVHKAVISLSEGKKLTETRHIQNLQINKHITPKLFDHTTFFTDVHFTDDFIKTYSN